MSNGGNGLLITATQENNMIEFSQESTDRIRAFLEDEFDARPSDDQIDAFIEVINFLIDQDA